MNLTPRWVQTLNSAQFEAVHWSKTGPVNAPDDLIFEFARDHGFILITNDLDFPRLLALSRNAQPSVILLRGEPLIPEVRGEALLRAIRDCARDLETGAIVTIDCFDRPRARVL